MNETGVKPPPPPLNKIQKLNFWYQITNLPLIVCEYVVSEDGLLRLYLFNQDTTYLSVKDETFSLCCRMFI